MTDSQKSSKIIFASVAVLISVAALACWQFYEYATFKHDNGLFNTEGGGGHLVWALLLGLIACGLGFAIASKLLRYEVKNELHITSPPRPRNSLNK